MEGVYVSVNDWNRVRPTEISFHMMRLSAAWAPANPFLSVDNPDLFNKHVGSTAWWDEIRQRGASARVEQFVDQWSARADRFQQA